MRVALQIISSNKNPHLEIYHQVRNIRSPEFEIPVKNAQGENTNKVTKHRTSKQFIQFSLINIGGQRAENVKLTLDCDFTRHSGREIETSIFKEEINQIGTGQEWFLFSLDFHDLYNKIDSKAIFKSEPLKIIAEYNPPSGFVNYIMSLPWKLRKKKRFTTEYILTPSLLDGEFPPTEFQ